MKALLIGLAAGVFLAGSVMGGIYTDTLNSQVVPSRREMRISTPQTYGQYSITRGNLTYSGALIQSMKTKSALDLITPARLDSGEYNLDRDIITSRPVGFKFLSINFN